ncbi:MAG TPA: hypothetical protein VFN48_03740 [Solirubrobacteraceae bacterium]|nr:hypothetical protein [Solirubrobacteraceae bacterium]
MSVEEPASEPASEHASATVVAPGGPGHRSGHLPPQVELGTLADGGLAPAVAAIVERGVRRRPHLANRLTGEVELKVVGPYPPTRVVFSPGHVLVDDGAATTPLLRVEGALADLVALLSTPVGFAGLPNPATPRGRAALALVARGRVRFEGPIGLRRELLRLLRV